MKKYRFLLVITFLMLSKISFCDVIPGNAHLVNICAKITNIEDYPEISLLVFYQRAYAGDKTYKVVSSECLKECYKYNEICIYAVSNKYLQGKNIENINWPNDKNAIKSNLFQIPYIGYIYDSNPISSVERFYKVEGFTDTTVILFKWKEVTQFFWPKPDSIKTYNFDGDTTKLSQKLPVGINSTSYHSTFTLYPNPAQQVVSLKISNFYEGTVPVEIVSFGGKVLRSTSLNKTGFVNDSSIPIENLPKGMYFVTIRFGAMVETQKLIIN